MFVSEHITDSLVSRGKIRRTIKGWQNYRTPAGLYVPAECEKETAVAVPADWSGSFDFKSQALACSLQSFVEDSDGTKDCTALWGIRKSDRPDLWVNFRAIDGQQNKTFSEGNKTTWVDLWRGCDLSIRQQKNEVQKIITLKDKDHPASFGFSVLMAEGMTCTLRDGLLRFFGSNGVEVFKTKPVYGKDSSAVAPFPDGKQHIRCGLKEGAPIGKLQTFWIVPDQDDLSKAVYPVLVDPTVEITSTSYIFDSQLYHDYPDVTAGNNATWSENHAEDVFILRYTSDQIPEGNISSHILTLWHGTNAGSTIAGYVMKDGNANWLPGTGGAPDVGKVDWNHVIANTQHWLGGAAFSSADYDADADPPSFVTGSYNYNDDFLSFDPGLAEEWRDGGRENNGFVMTSSGACTVKTMDSDEATRPSITIEYTPAGGPPRFFLARRP